MATIKGARVRVRRVRYMGVNLSGAGVILTGFNPPVCGVVVNLRGKYFRQSFSALRNGFPSRFYCR